MASVCTIQFNTHTVSVNLDDDGVYHVFKFTSTRCELESFANREDAEEYILYPFSSVEYSLTIHEDED
jgi:hypothetical protein